MKGWTEEEFADRRLMAPCGLYCGTCGVYIAERDGNDKFRAILGKLYGSDPELTRCKGCWQAEPPELLYPFCQQCQIRDCVRDRGYSSCHQCADFPCQHVDQFPLPVGRRVMQRAIQAWREKVAELGDEDGSIAWARAECERYHCHQCGEPLFRGALRCRACKAELADDLDGRNG